MESGWLVGQHHRGATGRPGIIERPTQVNKNASMVMAAAVLAETLPPAGAAVAGRLRAKGLSCLRRRILPAQMSDGYWHYGLTGGDPKNKEVLGYFLLSAGLLVRVRRLAPSFRDAALDAALDRAAGFAATRIAGRYDAATDPRRVFDLILLLADTGRTAQAARILDSAFDQFPYGNAGQDGADAPATWPRCWCALERQFARLPFERTNNHENIRQAGSAAALVPHRRAGALAASFWPDDALAAVPQNVNTTPDPRN